MTRLAPPGTAPVTRPGGPASRPATSRVANGRSSIAPESVSSRHRGATRPPPESGSPAGGAWLVDYEIGGQQLTDYWFYVHRRWVFDLVLSNPDAVKLYRMSPQQYAAAVGCAH